MSARPDWQLDRLRLGALPADEAKRFEAAMTDEDRARMAALSAEDEAILRRYPPAGAALEIQRRLTAAQRAEAKPTRGAFTWMAPALAMAAAAALALVLWTPERPSEAGSSSVASTDPDVRLKGDTRLLLFRARGGQSETLKPGAQAKAGDALQLGFITEKDGFGVILSIDGHGAITLHAPTDGQLTIKAGRTVLDFSYELDDAPRFERFFLVTSAAPIEVAQVRQAAARLAQSGAARTAALSLPSGLHQVSFLLNKP